MDVNQSEAGVVCKRKEKLSGLLNLKRECDAIEEQVLEAHDVFAIDEGERGEDTGPNICHHEMGPMVTQDFTVPKLPILTWR